MLLPNPSEIVYIVELQLEPLYLLLSERAYRTVATLMNGRHSSQFLSQPRLLSA